VHRQSEIRQDKNAQATCTPTRQDS
jgi:hypothetical protein